MQAFLRSRAFPLFVLLLLGLMPVVRFAQDGGAVLSAAAMVVGLAMVGILPGMLIAIIVGAVSAASLLESVAVGFAASFALVQLLTLIALEFHIGAMSVVLGLWALSAVLSVGLLIWPPKSGWALGAPRAAWAVVGLAIVLAASLYAQTPFEPWMTGEDAIHVAVVQRLAYEPSPTLTNVYWAPNFPYTYPYPATHYFIALVSRAAKLEPIFVYQKARMIWGPMTLLILFATARLIFRSERVALSAGLAAAALTLSGAFGPISTTWGQLAPVSHASDVAMTAVLPALLLLTLHYVAAERWRTIALYLVGALSVALTLVIVHIREVVQFLVYTIAAWGAYRWFVRDRGIARRFGVIAMLTLAITALYLRWYKYAVGHVDTVVGQRRAKLITDVSQMSWSEFFTPIWLNGYFTINHEYFYYMWFPVILLLAPWALSRWRSLPLVPFITTSLLAYALIVFVPFIAITYVYFTYYEILFTPVRNSLFFIYLLAGPIILLGSDRLATIARKRTQIISVLLTLGGLWLAFDLFGRFFKRSQNLTIQNVFFILIIVSYAVVLLRSRSGSDRVSQAPVEDGAIARMGPFYLLLAAVAMIGLSWSHSPLRFERATARWTMQQYLGAMPDIRADADSRFRDPLTDEQLDLGERVKLMAPPSEALIAISKRLPSNIVMVHNIFNTYASPVFLPQHIVMWPVDSAAGLEFNSRLFPKAWAAFVDSSRRHRAQPFFNEVESVEERAAYLRAIGATHALIDPMYYARLSPLFASWQSQFEVVYDDGSRWAIVGLRP